MKGVPTQDSITHGLQDVGPCATDTDVVDVVQAAEAAAEVEDCLLQHSADLARGLGLHLHVSSKTLTALPLVLPGFIPDQRGLPEFLITLADILGQAGGSHNVEGLAEVRQWRPTCHVSADSAHQSHHTPKYKDHNANAEHSACTAGFGAILRLHRLWGQS